MRIATLLFVLLLLGCTKELDVSFPVPEKQLVLNGVLHPDSTVHVSLTTTAALFPQTRDFPVVENAAIKLYEDDVLVGNLVFQDSLYVLDYHPKAGSTYTVEAVVPGYATLRASDVVPAAPDITVCYREDTEKRYQGRDAILEVAIDDPVQETNFYWLEEINTYPEFPRCRTKQDSIVWENGEEQVIHQDTIVCQDGAPPTFQQDRAYLYESFSPVPDRFNAYVDNFFGGVTVFEGFMRIEDAAMNGEVIAFDLSAGYYSYEYFSNYRHTSGQSSVTVNVINASQHYDRYLKSSITYMLNESFYSDEEIGFKPFAEVIQVYSNVENGVGIFAAYNSTSREVGDFPCE